MAEPMPQSWKRFIMSGGISATAYSPYSPSSIRLPRIIVPMAIIIVEMVFPMNRWRLPVAEILPISDALSIFWFLSWIWSFLVTRAQ